MVISAPLDFALPMAKLIFKLSAKQKRERLAKDAIKYIK